MTTKLEQAAREVVRQHSMECLSDKTVDALREALAEPKKPEECANGCPPLQVCDYCQIAEQAEQEPVAPYEMLTDDEIQMLWVNWDANRTSEWYECIEDLVHVVEDYIIQKQTEINPLGYLDESDLRGLAQGNAVWIYPEDQGRMVAIYAAPVRTKDLTDDEKLELARSSVGKSRHWLVEAAIAADREKNK